MQRLKQLRSELNITQGELANKLGLPRATYSFYERGERQPDYGTLMNFANFFDVSVDYLLGNSNVRKFEADSLSFSVTEELTKEEYEDIQEYINFKLSRRNKK